MIWNLSGLILERQGMYAEKKKKKKAKLKKKIHILVDLGQLIERWNFPKQHTNLKLLNKEKFLFFFNWDSFYGTLNSHYEAWSYKKKKYKKIKACTKSV